MSMSEAPILSVVAPCYNEQGNLIPLITAIREALEPLKISYEIVIADDCSRDDSWNILQKLGAEDQRIRAVRLNHNCGQSAAVWAGIQAATGRYIATLDADLQNHPRELPRFLEAIERDRCDCVCGSRVAAPGFFQDCQRHSQQHNARDGERFRLRLPHLQARVRDAAEIFQGHAPLHADAVPHRGLCRDGNPHQPPHAAHRPEPLRRAEPAVRDHPRFVRRALDAEADVPLRGEGAN
jgi:glycosyltransferase involved in cell wall biosynthesis